VGILGALKGRPRLAPAPAYTPLPKKESNQRGPMQSTVRTAVQLYKVQQLRATARSQQALTVRSSRRLPTDRLKK
jgi:hypothetical protein